MAKLKYSIFHCQGGFGKHIAATAVAKCIKNNHQVDNLLLFLSGLKYFKIFHL